MKTLSEAYRRSLILPPESDEQYFERKRRNEDEIRAGLREQDRARRLAVLRRDSQLGDRFKSRTFASWRASPETQQALEAAKTVAADHRRGLWICGPVGCGKTHLAAAIANDTLDRGIPTRFMTGVKMLDKLRASIQDDAPSDIIAQYAAVDVLVFDDAGKERLSAWAAERLFEITNDRYERNLPIIVTSNLTPDELATQWSNREVDPHLGASISRRLAEMTGAIVQIGAPS